MGGPQLSLSQLLIGGRVDMVDVDALEALNYAQGGPAVPLHRRDLPEGSAGADLPIPASATTVSTAQGQADPGRRRRARTSYWPFLKAKYGYTDEQMRPYTFNLAPFLADKNLPAGLHHRPSPSPCARPAPIRCHADRRRRLRQLQHHDHDLEDVAAEKKDVVQRFVTASPKAGRSTSRAGPPSRRPMH